MVAPLRLGSGVDLADGAAFVGAALAAKHAPAEDVQQCRLPRFKEYVAQGYQPRLRRCDVLHSAGVCFAANAAPTGLQRCQRAAQQRLQQLAHVVQ